MAHIECKTAAQVKKAVKNGDTALILGMIAMTLAQTPEAMIVVLPGAYLNLTLDSSQATIKTFDSSQATIKTLDSSQATIETFDSSQATIKTLGSSQATIKTFDSSQATIKTLGSSQATIETFDSSQATIETLGSSQATIKTLGSSQAAIETWGSSQATIKTWGSKVPPPPSVTEIGGHLIAADRGPLLTEVAAAALASPDALAMSDWHTCETTHCISGWATFKAGDLGKELEAKMGPHSAGLVLLGREAAGHFYDSNDQARDWLKQFVPVAPESAQ